MKTLTSQQTRRLERDLQAQRMSILDKAHDELAHADEFSYSAIAGEVPDFGDQATAESLTDYTNGIARHHVEMIREIDDALSRIETHEFGRCTECGNDIPLERLQAFPTARRCVTCQTLRERTFAFAGTRTL